MSFIADEWSYLQEGGVNIVFNYKGGQQQFKGKVVKIAKDVLQEAMKQDGSETVMKQIGKKLVR